MYMWVYVDLKECKVLLHYFVTLSTLHALLPNNDFLAFAAVVWMRTRIGSCANDRKCGLVAR